MKCLAPWHRTVDSCAKRPVSGAARPYAFLDLSSQISPQYSCPAPQSLLLTSLHTSWEILGKLGTEPLNLNASRKGFRWAADFCYLRLFSSVGPVSPSLWLNKMQRAFWFGAVFTTWWRHIFPSNSTSSLPHQIDLMFSVCRLGIIWENMAITTKYRALY